MQNTHILLAAVLASSVLLQGCASSSEISDAALSGDPAAMSRDGARLNSNGAEWVKKGERGLIDGRKQIRDGESMVSKGSSLVRSARAEYINIASSGGSATSPDAVSDEAKRLRDIGNEWEDAIEMIRDGNKLVEKGNKNINTGQADIRKGREMMETGSTLVRNSERLRLGETLLPESQ